MTNFVTAVILALCILPIGLSAAEAPPALMAKATALAAKLGFKAPRYDYVALQKGTRLASVTFPVGDKQQTLNYYFDGFISSAGKATHVVILMEGGAGPWVVEGNRRTYPVDEPIDLGKIIRLAKLPEMMIVFVTPTSIITPGEKIIIISSQTAVQQDIPKPKPKPKPNTESKESENTAPETPTEAEPPKGEWQWLLVAFDRPTLMEYSAREPSVTGDSNDGK